MRITSLHINKFRLFKNIDFTLGKYLTIFSGTNAVGKSTLLGILGNSSELKPKDGRPLLQNRFRTEFSETFKMSHEHDPSASNVLTVKFSDESNRTCRITWQKDSKTEKPRPRLIPEYKDVITGKKHSQKKAWPTLFLGLSRLYPVGESDAQNLTHQKYKDISSDDWQRIIQNYKKILSIMDNISDVQSITIPETSRKKAFGVVTNDYDYFANSAGQDNLGQILLAIESFRRLKTTKGSLYQGGLLLVDELDATLHPSAQINLVKYLLKEAKKLELQIVFTTHSLSILNYAAKLMYSCVSDDLSNNDTNLYYLSRANGPLQLLTNPPYTTIKGLLNDDPITAFHNKVKVYTEDPEARWFINQINEAKSFPVLSRLNLLDIYVGKDSMLSIVKGDPIEYLDKIIILDGDASQNVSTAENISELNSTGQNILTLPGASSPENEIIKFLTNDSDAATEYFQQTRCVQLAITKSHFIGSIPNNSSRTNTKEFFKNYENIFAETHLMRFWIAENQESINCFITKLNEMYTKIAKYSDLIPLPPAGGQTP